MGVAGGDLKENGRGCVADAKGGPQGQQSEVRGPQTAPSRIVDEAELLLQNLDGWKGIEPFSSHSMIPPLRCSGDDTNSKSRAHDPLSCFGMRVVTLWTARGRVRAFRRIIGSRVRNGEVLCLA